MRALLFLLVTPAFLFSGMAKANLVDSVAGFASEDSYTAVSNIFQTGIVYDNGGVVSGTTVTDPLKTLDNTTDAGGGLTDGTSFSHEYIFSVVADTTFAISTTIENTLGGLSSAFTVNMYDLSNSIDLGTTALILDAPNNNKSATVGLNMIAGDSYMITLAGDTGTSENTANYTMKLQVVPVPAAVWLFGTALLGLLGFRRKDSIDGAVA